jgi:hypothetical protein
MKTYIVLAISETAMGGTNNISEYKKQIVKNLSLSNIGEEFVAMQADWEIPVVTSILKELDVYRGPNNDELKMTLVNRKM